MQVREDHLIYSPSDLTLFTESPFASWMEHQQLIHPSNAPQPDKPDELLSVLANRGITHEEAALDRFKQQGLSVADCSQAHDPIQATIDAMKQGSEVIFQAALSLGSFAGFADFLLKVPGNSNLGDYHYEVWDTKLSRSVKPYFIIQLCCYQEMIEAIQGKRSENSVVLLGNNEEFKLRTDDYYFYYQSIKREFLKLHEHFDPKQQPSPADSSSWGRWSEYAKQQLVDIDHLSQVATISRSQIKKLKAAEITTMQQLVDTDTAHVTGINPTVFKRLKAQARIQKETERQHQSNDSIIPAFEILIPEPDSKQGLALLPPHSPLDVFFDIEGFPLDEGGLEYLWGNTYFDSPLPGNNRGQRQFKDFWAHNPQEEKQAFQAFIQWVYERWQQDPLMHIYHYANYEIAACKKLMSRYGVCEYEVDQLLRNEVFVDLYKIVKSGILLGEPKYSIKNVEHLYRGKRDTEVGTGGDSVVVYEHWRENPDGDHWSNSKILNDIREYNINDCDSTQELVDWLRDQQQKHDIAYVGKTEVIEPEATEEITAKTQLRDRLLDKSEALRETNPTESQLTENLAWCLEFHRRENKPTFWRLFERLGMTEVELFDDLNCLALCERTEREPFKPTPRAKNLAYEYRFDVNQDFKAGQIKAFYLLGEESEEGKNVSVSVVDAESDYQQGMVVVQSSSEPPPFVTLIPDEYVRPDPIPAAIEEIIRDQADSPQSCAIMDFLQRKTPRIKGHASNTPIVDTTDEKQRLTQIISRVENLDNSYLVIQGPPGAGKTYTGKHIIAHLLQLGKTIGICSNSHKAINNLLIGTAEYCQAKGIDAHFTCTKNTDDAIETLNISVIKNPKITNHIQPACVIGTTAWGFCRDELADTLDYLFIDEAGQVSIANLIGISRAANNLVLMGDQMQLGQPAQGSHPADSGLSTLDYLLHNQATIPPEMGVFLGTTYRMHSNVNQFISAAIYEGELHSHPDNDRQLISVPDGYRGILNQQAGIQFIPVNHEGNTQASVEEVEVIHQLTQDLLGRAFADKEGNERQITLDDILFVAPYNHQVSLLRMKLGDQAKIGSVDKFQGQEAPIVFLSMCASDPNESPRGIDFLFDKHRINVAISRAQSLAIVVGNPNLTLTSTSNPNQMKQVNLMARLIQDYSV